jgi:hypothetical protein
LAKQQPFGRLHQRFWISSIRYPQDVVVALHARHNMLWNDPCVRECSGLRVLEQDLGDLTMAKRQTRRSISVKGITYQRLKNFCETQGLSVSGYLEDIIANRLDEANVPVPERVDPRPEPVTIKQPGAPGDPDEIISQHFTF